MSKEMKKVSLDVTLSYQQWDELTKYATNEGKTLQEFLSYYVAAAVVEALREGYILDAMKNV